MKLRNGFVSNSSSASFIVIIDKPKEEILKNLYHASDYFDAYSMKERFEKSISLFSKEDIFKREELVQKYTEAMKLIREDKHDKSYGYDRTTLHIEYANISKLMEVFLNSNCVFVESADGKTKIMENITMMNSEGDFNLTIKEIVFLLVALNIPFEAKIEED